MAFIFANNASSVLAAPLGSGDTSLSIRPADADAFPEPNAIYFEYEQFSLTIKNQDTGEYEIVYCTERDGTVLQVDRGQEGTVALDFPAGAIVSHNLTAGVLEYLRDL